MSDFVFGPVPSRRLGRSLGVDLVPFKTCSYDCIYCQLGRTTCRTIERREWAPLDRVVEDIGAALVTRPDYITLSGSGEPTLFSRLDELIDRIKGMTQVPVAVLTNGSLLWREDVRRQLAKADVVLPSLDAGSAPLFHLVNRPHAAIPFEKVLGGLIAFRRGFRGQVWLEVFILEAYTVFEPELASLRACAELIRPDRVQLNTVTRPPVESFAIGVRPERLREVAASFDPPAEVIADYQAPDDLPAIAAGAAEILELLRRRPCSVDDIAAGLGIHRNEVVKCLERLQSEGLVERQWAGDICWYKASAGQGLSIVGAPVQRTCGGRDFRQE